ncbi:MAG: DNA-binding protein [Spirulina sp. SIO3F2]|nr:DNA-binding protein [Spirulina sp. SIO3F2]
MQDYEFTLEFELQDPHADPADYVEQLYESGCDDALIGIGRKGRISFDFIREATSMAEARESAIADIHQVLPFAILIELSKKILTY